MAAGACKIIKSTPLKTAQIVNLFKVDFLQQRTA
jgi:hypothetical protein